MIITKKQLKKIISEVLRPNELDYASRAYQDWVRNNRHLTPNSSSVLASYVIESGFEEDLEMVRGLAQAHGIEPERVVSEISRQMRELEGLRKPY
jgi:hypothetical protein